MSSEHRPRGGAFWPVLMPLALAFLAATACAPGAVRAHSAGANLQDRYQQVISQTQSSVVEVQAGNSVAGAGVVFDSRGDIVTNATVVGTAKSLKVAVSGLSTALRAHLVGVFAPDDLAVIRARYGKGYLRAARWADSSKLQVGQLVLSMGSPYGLADSVTEGIVSATGRTVNGPPAGGKPRAAITDAIQTSAAINAGNNGGALVLLSGYVAGIPTLGATDPQLGTTPGIGFAIPANTVRDIAAQLIRTGKVSRPGRASLQITGRTHTNAEGRPDGVSVVATQRGGSAARAGIVAGDVIAGFAGQPTPTLNKLEDILSDHTPGRRVRVELLRNGNPREVTAKLGRLGS